MGMIRIDINGSFAPGGMAGSRSFGAMKSGHAAALGEAIAHLASLMPQAVALDHSLHADDAYPTDRFGLPA